jgi:transposase
MRGEDISNRQAAALFDNAILVVLEKLAERLPAVLIDTLREQWNRLAGLDKENCRDRTTTTGLDETGQGVQGYRRDSRCGLANGHGGSGEDGNAKVFKSGREFAARPGLVPGQVGTGGKVKLLGISKRGDTYLRTRLIHGARAVLTHAKEPSAWAEQLGKRPPPNAVTVALANKIARIIWALLAHDKRYQKDQVSVQPV